jgi:hypothetical protein
MQLPVCALLSWLTIILFAKIPKKLSILDIVFLYCVIIIISEPTYTFFELNMHSVTVPRVGTSVISVGICRLITIPLFIIMAVNALLSFGKMSKWGLSIIIWFGLVIFDFILNRFHIIEFHYPLEWQLVSSLITNLGFIIIGWGLMKWYKRHDLEKVTPL